MNVNVTPTSHDIGADTPEIRKYKKRFNSEILCAALWGNSSFPLSSLIFNFKQCMVTFYFVISYSLMK